MIRFSGCTFASLVLLLGTVVHPGILLVGATKFWEGRPYSQFVPYADEDKLILEMQDTNLAAVAPKVSIISSIPEPPSDHNRYVWPYIEGLAVRNAESKIMNLQPVYMMKHGLEMGCRMHRVGGGGENSTGDHVPIDSPICDDHCTHQGQYCPAELPYDLASRTKYHGKDLILEIVRRLCFGSVLQGNYANHLWFEYLKNFDISDCLEGDTPLKECSLGIISSITTWEVDGSQEEEDYNRCVADADAETDTPNPMLENQLRLLKDVEYTWEDLPVFDINGQKIEEKHGGGFRADYMTHQWCSFFPPVDVPAEEDPEHPVISRPISCDFCSRCDYVAKCLWFDRCDNHAFDLETFHDPKGQPTAKEKVEEIAEEVMDDTEVAVEDLTIAIMYVAAGVAFGATAVLLICAVLNRRRRLKAVDEVANELPVVGGYQDEVSDH